MQAPGLLGCMHVPVMALHRQRYHMSERARLNLASPESWAILGGMEKMDLGTDP